jgi:hypothetical protein
MKDGRVRRAWRISVSLTVLVVALGRCGEEAPVEPVVSPSWTVVEGSSAPSEVAVAPEATEPATAPVAQNSVPLGLFVYAYEVGETPASIGYRFGDGTWQRLIRERVTASGTWTIISSMADTRVVRLSDESGAATPLVMIHVTADSFAMEAAETVVFQRVEEPTAPEPVANPEGSGAPADGSTANAASVEGSAAPAGGTGSVDVPAEEAAPSAPVPTGTGTSIRLDLAPMPTTGTTP